jgi:adenylate cyclase
MVTCAFAYLLSELTLRPVAARALSGDDEQMGHTPGIAVRTLLMWVVGTGAPAAGLLIVATVVLADDGVSASELARTVVGLAGILLVVGLGLLSLATRAVVDPLSDLDAGLRRVEAGDLETRIVVYDGSEIGRVQSAFNEMVIGLEERARLRDLFGRHVGAEVAEAALERGAQLGGEQCEATAVFVDIIGSTSLAEGTDPRGVVDILNAFYEHVVGAVEAQGGWINKFEGDAALCVFGPPNGLADHADAALRAVADLRGRLDEFAKARHVEAAIGVASGLVVAGNVGTPARYEYTVIGDPVNTAARLSELAKECPEKVLVAASTIGAARPEARTPWSEVDRVVLRGKSEPTSLHTLRG